MADTWSQFLDSATLVNLKKVLIKLKLPTSGNKSALKVRIQEAVEGMSEEDRQGLIPDDLHGAGDDLHEAGDDHMGDENTSDDEENASDDQEEEDLDEELEKLREILKKKQEILDLKKKIAELQIAENGVASRSPSYTFKDMEDSIPTYNGDDNLPIQRWIEQFEDSATLMGLDGKTKLIFAKRMLSGTAKLFVRTISPKTWDDLKKKLIEEFKKHVTKADIHSELRQRRKRRDENMKQYLLSMQEIASAGSIDEQDLIDYIIKGIPDNEINKLLLYGANNINELKIALRKYEKLKMNCHDSNYKKSDPPEIKVKSNHSANKIKCFNCKEVGHYSKFCTKPRRKDLLCFKCNKPGHKSSACSNEVMALQQPADDSKSLHNVNGDTSLGQVQGQNFIEDYYGKNNFIRVIKYSFIKNNAESNTSLSTLIDTGSPISFVQQKFVPTYLMTTTNEGKYNFCGINNSPLSVLGIVNSNVYFENFCVNLNLLVVKNDTMQYPVILGRNFLEMNNLILQREKEIYMKNDNMTVDEQGSDENKRFFNHSSDLDTSVKPVSKNNDDFLEEILNIDASNNNTEINFKINEKLTYQIKKQIEEILKPALFSNSNAIPEAHNFEMKINLTDEKPFYCVPRRLPYAHKIELQKILDDLLSKGIIRESMSPFASPIVLVRKKSGEFRLCVDFRELNKVTVRDNFPLPLIEDQLDRLSGMKYFTTLDLKNGFHHVKIAEDSIKYTSFITPLGQYEYTRMPFGLKNSPSVFERYMKYIFKDLLKAGKILTFIDDILIATQTVEENIEILKEVMSIVKQNALQLRLDKCSFVQEEVIYLGYKINVEGIRPNEDHLKAVKDFPVPKCTKDVHGFLGLCSYFRKFIQNFASIAKPLYSLLRKDVPFTFGVEEFNAFELLKHKLIEAPVLSIYSPNNETELHCDASSIGFGAVLMQKQADKKFHPVFYFSKRTTDIESKYHSYELETLAIVYALRRFRIYLLGIDFKIITDCQALSLTLSKKLLNPRISRWALEMQSFNYRVEHRKGDKMQHADALSRSVNILNIYGDSFEFVLAAMQRQDPKIAEIVSQLEKSESPMYEMIDGLIYRKAKDKVLFYVPKNMETQVIRTHHEAMSHLGTEKCYEFISRSYWFPEMKNKIKNYIKTCLKCIYFSPVSGKVEGILHNIPKGCIPFDTLHIDHFGPLANSKTKKQHIFLVIDAFTKFVKLYTVRTTQSKEAISCLQSYFENYSRPNRIVSDRGTCFTSNEFNEFLKSNNIQHVKIASHCPQANGQVERVNRILTPMLSKECDAESTADWHKHLAKIEFSLNNTVNRSTGFTPSMLLFGRNQKGTFCDKILEYIENNVGLERQELTAIREQAGQNIEKHQDYNKLNYDKHHKRPYEYKVGDYVMIKNVAAIPGVNKKLFAKYRGPYEVEKVLPNDRYLVKDIDGMQLTRIPYKGVCAPCNMKPFITGDPEFIDD